MEQQSRIQKIIAKTNCSYNHALEADNESKGNLDLAYEIAKKKSNELYVGGGSSGLAVESGDIKNEIVGYKNGLLVNNKFYDYSENDNMRLKKMLEKNEFDANILGVNDSRAEVVYKNCEDEMYQNKEKKKEKTWDESKKHVLNFDSKIEISCPDEIIMDKDGDITFKIFVDGRRIPVVMNNNMKVADLYHELKKYTKKNIVLMKGNKKVEFSDDITSLKRNMLIMREEK